MTTMLIAVHGPNHPPSAVTGDQDALFALQTAVSNGLIIDVQPHHDIEMGGRRLGVKEISTRLIETLDDQSMMNDPMARLGRAYDLARLAGELDYEGILYTTQIAQEIFPGEMQREPHAPMRFQIGILTLTSDDDAVPTFSADRPVLDTTVHNPETLWIYQWSQEMPAEFFGTGYQVWLAAGLRSATHLTTPSNTFTDRQEGSAYYANPTALWAQGAAAQWPDQFSNASTLNSDAAEQGQMSLTNHSAAAPQGVVLAQSPVGFGNNTAQASQGGVAGNHQVGIAGDTAQAAQGGFGAVAQVGAPHSNLPSLQPPAQPAQNAPDLLNLAANFAGITPQQVLNADPDTSMNNDRMLLLSANYRNNEILDRFNRTLLAAGRQRFLSTSTISKRIAKAIEEYAAREGVSERSVKNDLNTLRRRNGLPDREG